MSNKLVFMGNDDYNEYMSKLFEMFDFEKTGTIDTDVCKMLMSSLGKPINPAVLNKIEKNIENDGRDGMSYMEFVSQIKKVFPLGKVGDDLKYAFTQASDGEFITFESLKKANEHNDLGFTDTELRAIMKEFDKSGKNQISFETIAEIFKTDDIDVEIDDSKYQTTNQQQLQ